MRASLNKLKTIEDFLQEAMKPQDALLFRAKLLIDPVLRLKTTLQQKTYVIIQIYGRREVTREIQSVQEKLFSDTSRTDFHKKINLLFPKQ